MLVRREPRPKIGALICIHGPREFGIELDIKYRLDLIFDDVDVVDAEDVKSHSRALTRRREEEKTGLKQIPPTKGHVESIITFAESVRKVEGVVFCHCRGGICRSPAAALICLATWRGHGLERQCMHDVLRVRPAATPHMGMIRLADELLSRNGALVRAAEFPR